MAGLRPKSDPWPRPVRVRRGGAGRGVRCHHGAVDPEHPRGQAAPVGLTAEAWLIDAMPSVTQLLAAVHQVPGVLAEGAPATAAAGAGLAAATGSARAWLAVHPCPDTEVGELFEGAFGQFTTLAERCAMAARTIGDHRGRRHHDLDGRAARATADLMIALSAAGSPASGPDLA